MERYWLILLSRRSNAIKENIMTRKDGRELDEIRRVEMLTGFTRFAEGSCLIEVGDTMVLCNASVEERVPPHVTSGGWITAE